ncbi:hypothetical protein PCANC_11417 [Puccinia coronata f. sp. avenae]|uniref:Reverse transcriptase Ty1/copia-type domain-containing protein n=1 Tax=Puccinia coronata f. sp. avenae TaxID=200324 RepID=A0A2N5UB28_9BASI|nr:hypothetical protein PCASD_14250 [Puccinia coronata f. sp. avenae]PLW51208.1 hypothetical protein PCANC_11417 [Puccinia coronata f. sp. avenae]
MASEFQIKYMGAASFLLGMKLERVNGGLILHQNQYIERKLIEFNLARFSPSTCPIDPNSHLGKANPDELAQFAALGINYRALVGSLNYLSILTRPDISYSVSKLLQFLEGPGINHYCAAVQVFRYLHHTKSLGYLATINHHIVSWKSLKQCTVSLSSTEAEYKALADAGKEASWLINLCQEIFCNTPTTLAVIKIDNCGAIDLACSQISQNSFREHMDLHLHYIQDLIKAKVISLKYVASVNNSANFLTKPVGRSRIVCSLQPYTLTALNISASHPMVPSTGACQDVIMGTSPEPNYDDFIAEAINHTRQSHDTTSATQTLEVPDAW